MTIQHSSVKQTMQPSLDELTARFLAARVASAGDPMVEVGEVVPHEVAGGFRAPTRLTWDEALTALRVLGVDAEHLPAPTEWAAFINLDLPPVALPLAAGLFPQRFRQVPGSLASGDLRRMLPSEPGERVSQFHGLRGWIRKTLRSTSATALLVASGVAATLGDWSDADEALKAAEALGDARWHTACENQRAALLWLRGRHDDALRAWNAISDQRGVALNRGMAELFTGGSTDTVTTLEAAAAGLPESSGWCHLARLYLSLARSRRV